MTTTAEKIEANANLIRWCVHVLGPDDVLAAPSHDAAATHAHEMNKAVFSRRGSPEEVLCFAYAAPWPYSVAAHTEAVAEWLKESTPSIPTSEGEGK